MPVNIQTHSNILIHCSLLAIDRDSINIDLRFSLFQSHYSLANPGLIKSPIMEYLCIYPEYPTARFSTELHDLMHTAQTHISHFISSWTNFRAKSIWPVLYCLIPKFKNGVFLPFLYPVSISKVKSKEYDLSHVCCSIWNCQNIQASFLAGISW